MSYRKETKKDFSQWVEDNYDSGKFSSYREAQQVYWRENFPEERKAPSASTIFRWLKKYSDLYPLSEDNNSGRENMETDGKESINQQVKDTDVKDNYSKEYDGGTDEAGTEDKKRGKEGPSNTSTQLDLSKITDWFKSHKLQVGLFIAGVAAVGLAGRFRTVNVDRLQGHGTSDNGGNQSNSHPPDYDDSGAWTGE